MIQSLDERTLYCKQQAMVNTGGIKGLQKPVILFNNYGGEFSEGEAFVTDHIFSYIVSGMQEIWSGNQTYFQDGRLSLF